MLSASLLLAGCTVTFTGEAEPVTVRPTPAPTPTPTPTPSPSPSPAPSPSPITPSFPLNESITYSCTNARMVVRYPSNDSAQVFYGEWLTLTRTVSQDGWFVYRDSDYAWFARGNEGYLQYQGDTVRSRCSY